jgi:Kef-type K+ transport system membrane component KefB
MSPRIVLLLAAVLTVGPRMALAAGGEGQGAVSRVLFALGVLLLAANLGGLAAERLGQPPVLGELVIGIVLASLVVLLRGAEGRSAGVRRNRSRARCLATIRRDGVTVQSKSLRSSASSLLSRSPSLSILSQSRQIPL